MAREERACELCGGLCHNNSTCRFRGMYVKGATEQRKIDADIICDLMISMLNDGMIETRDIGAVNTIFRKAMEEE